MSNDFVNPNLHVVLVHYPLALLIIGTLIELFSFLWRRSGFRAAGRWMILLGAISAVPTAFSGMYALADVAMINNHPASGAWKDVAASSPMTAQQWDFLEDHTRLQSIATSLCMFVVVIWIGCSDRGRRRLHIPLLVLLLIGVGVISSGAWHGGEAVYRFGTGVKGEVESAAHGDGHGDTEFWRAEKQIERFVPPLQTHVILAGFAVALALVTLGLAVRASRYPIDLDRAILSDSGDTGVTHLSNDDVRVDTLRDSPGAVAVVSVNDAIFPAARFWLLTMLLALCTAVAGLWFLASDSSTWSPHELWEIIQTQHAPPRRLPHVVGGISLVVLTLILAMLARWAPRRKFVLFIFSLLLLAAVAWQLWFGLLMLFDTPQGPYTRFNPSLASETPSTIRPATTQPATRLRTQP